jgi:hypothetical protein
MSSIATGLPYSPLPHATRKAVFTALFDLIQKIPAPADAPNWKTASQLLKSWDEVNAGDQPALFLHRGPQQVEQKTFGVTRWLWKCSLWIYFRADNLKTVSTYPDQYTDAFLDSVELAFQTEPLLGRLTLGGLAWHCWLDGQVFSDPGINDSQAVIVIPISILL